MTNYNYLQRAAIDKVAKENELTKKQVEDIFSKLCEYTREQMQSFEENEVGVKNLESFKIIHIQNFGKFIPNKKMIKAVNNKLINNEQRKKTKES